MPAPAPAAPGETSSRGPARDAERSSPGTAGPSSDATAALAPSAAAGQRTAPRATGAGFSEDAIRKVYPRSAIRMGLEGLVVLDVQVGPDGRAATVKVRQSSGYDVLDEAAASMAREARYAAATVDGRPVADWLPGLRIRFSLER
jgi:protein TonB